MKLGNCYKMYRTDGSMKGKSSVGTNNIVATDFNPLMRYKIMKWSSVGTKHF